MCFTILLWLLGLVALWVASAYLVNMQKPRKKGHLVILLGSGGHTGEMLYMMLKHNFENIEKIYCVVADNDPLSIGKMKNFVEKHKVRQDDCR